MPYLSALPYARQPVASQWEINAWMLALLNARYCPEKVCLFSTTGAAAAPSVLGQHLPDL